MHQALRFRGFLRILGPVVACACCLTARIAPAAGPADELLEDEIRFAHRWAAAALAKPGAVKPHVPPPADALIVLRKSHKVLTNRTVWNTPLTLGDHEFAHGIYMDAPAAVRVRLARPAVELTATVGIDNNRDTQRSPHTPSARFHVAGAGTRVFSSPVCRLRDGGTPVKVSLNGAKEYVIEVDDGGDGRAFDQCVWADAAVRFTDGSTRFLDELPLGARRTRQTTAPFSFTYGGQSSETLLPKWDYSVKSEPAENGSRRVVSYQCPKTGLRLECQVTMYPDAAAIDWVFCLINEGPADTPVIDGFLPLDATLIKADRDQAITLRWSNGDSCSPDSFLPHDEPLMEGQMRQLAPSGGRSSNGAGGGALPFFNCLGPGGGWVLAAGWSGQWTAEFVRESDGSLTAGAGMETTHFRLRSGERVRTPRIVLLRYHGDAMIRGHNRFRKLMLDHYVQRRGGKPAAPPVAHNTAATVYRSGQEATETNQLAILRRAAELGCEAYWMDAYWYPRPWHANVGNWFCRPDDFPRGLRPLADAAHEAGMKFVLWFEPERVAPGTEFDRQRPELLLKTSETGNRLFNLADPEARRFLTGFLDERIKKWRVDVYRNDFNIDPLSYWQAADAEDRQGITEMRYVEGLYEMWSELLRRNPGLFIDNCASGGRRIDLETCSLSWPLWRSDLNDIGEGLKGEAYWPQMARADQVHVTGLALYVPFQSGPLWDMHPYSFRSAMTSSVVLYERILHDDFPAELAKKGIAELKELRPLFLGDLYPLLPLTTSPSDWYAYQLDRPDLGEGCALFFRRPKSPDKSRQVQLQSIDPEATYLVTLVGETYNDPNVGHVGNVPHKMRAKRAEILTEESKPQRMLGRELRERSVQIPSRPGSALLRYRQVRETGAESDQ